MAWLELHQELPRHPKLARLAAALRCPRHEALGLLCETWLWALTYAPTGDLTDVTTEFLQDAIGTRRPGLLAALTTSGFAESVDGRILLHDWQQYAGRLLAAREAKRATERRRYAASLPTERQQSAASLPNTVQYSTKPPDRARARGPENFVKDAKVQAPTNGELPPELRAAVLRGHRPIVVPANLGHDEYVERRGRALMLRADVEAGGNATALDRLDEVIDAYDQAMARTGKADGDGA